MTTSASGVVETVSRCWLNVPALLTPLKVTRTARSAAIVRPPNSVHSTTLLLGLPQLPTSSPAATSRTTPPAQPAKPVPIGNVTRIRSFAPSAPPAEVVNPRTYVVRAAVAFVGTVLSTETLVTPLAKAAGQMARNRVRNMTRWRIRTQPISRACAKGFGQLPDSSSARRC